MHTDLGQGRAIKALQKLAGFFGIGLMDVNDPDYAALVEAYRTISIAYRKGDVTTILTTLDRDYVLVSSDHETMKRSAVEEQLRTRLDNQISSDYREEPAHFIIRGKRAHVVSRIFSKSVIRRNGKLVELQERGDQKTTWVKSNSGWKREITRIRTRQQNIEWLAEPVEAPASRTEKFLI